MVGHYYDEYIIGYGILAFIWGSDTYKLLHTFENFFLKFS